MEKIDPFDASYLDRSCADYPWIETFIDLVDSSPLPQPTLEQIATQIGDGGIHQRVQRWAGTTPERFMSYLSPRYAQVLRDRGKKHWGTTPSGGTPIPAVARLHNLTLFKKVRDPSGKGRNDRGAEIRYGTSPSPFGLCFIAFLRRGGGEEGICYLRFIPNGLTPGTKIDGLRAQWPEARLLLDSRWAEMLAQRVFAVETTLPGPEGPVPERERDEPIPLCLEGSPFHLRVWEALIQIPLGTAVTYQEIALALGKPKAARAVGQAVASNRIPFLIPCHRVLPKGDGFGNYGEGPLRKQAMLAWEAARVEKFYPIPD